jgi:hypothetical protein
MDWIPAFAGMTAAWSARVSQMTPLLTAAQNLTLDKFLLVS